MKNNKKSKKRKWTTPQLIVLVKGKGERVLLTCKDVSGAVASDSTLDSCLFGARATCVTACDDIVTS